MREIIKEELSEILENHQHWMDNKDVVDWEQMREDLRYADLKYKILNGADLNMRANLEDADLRYAILKYVILNGADLTDATLYGANLGYANLRCATLVNADLRSVNLYGADLRGADLRYADLRGADLKYADLRGANLYDANLYKANLYGAKNIPFIPLACPEKGVFIGFKKASAHIVELEILEDARRCSATSHKCRCDKAKVISITKLNGSPTDIKEIASDYDGDFIYKVGEIVEEPKFDEDRWNECSSGIHFFINRQEAVDYIC